MDCLGENCYQTEHNTFLFFFLMSKYKEKSRDTPPRNPQPADKIVWHQRAGWLSNAKYHPCLFQDSKKETDGYVINISRFRVRKTNYKITHTPKKFIVHQ